MSERALIVGFTWVEGSVQLRSWAGSPSVLTLRPLEGCLSFRMLAGKHCVGWNDGETLRACPDHATATRGPLCDACYARDAFRPCMTCDGFRCPRLSPEMESWCRQTHHLYLACFGDTRLKVGTASDGRREQRIVEQGPLAAARIASAPGPRIKQMEHVLVEAGFSEAMRRARKTVLMQASMTAEQAEELVRSAARSLRRVLPGRYHRHLHAPEFVAQPDVAVRSRARTVNELRLEEDRVVEGTVVGAVGHLLFLEDGDGCFALDLGDLKGRRIEWDPVGPRRRASAQLGLF